MADSVTPLGEGLRKLERSMSSVSANMDRLLAHFGLTPATDEEIDRALADEATTTPTTRSWWSSSTS